MAVALRSGKYQDERTQLARNKKREAHGKGRGWRQPIHIKQKCWYNRISEYGNRP
jgi:hypothetical protein